jgi:hypothetical protein
VKVCVSAVERVSLALSLLKGLQDEIRVEMGKVAKYNPVQGSQA